MISAVLTLGSLRFACETTVLDRELLEQPAREANGSAG
jgi:hypothetical protein